MSDLDEKVGELIKQNLKLCRRSRHMPRIC
jgi:hypothetical protein